jgi:hypothetical protein
MGHMQYGRSVLGGRTCSMELLILLSQLQGEVYLNAQVASSFDSPADSVETTWQIYLFQRREFAEAAIGGIGIVSSFLEEKRHA